MNTQHIVSDMLNVHKKSNIINTITMKTIFKSTLLLLCSVCLFTACDDDNDSNPVLLQPDSFVLNTPAYSTSTIDLQQTTSIPFTWSQPDYGFPVAANYQMQVSLTNTFNTPLTIDENDNATGDFATLNTIYATPSGSIDATVLLRTLISLGGWDENNVPETATVYVRAIANTPGASEVVSNSVSIIVAPYIVTTPAYAEFIYEIGNESGWTTAYPMRSVNLDGIYQSYNYLDGGFKFRPNADNWENDFGQDPNGDFGALVTEGEEDCNKSDGSFQDKLLEKGFYQINVDIIEMTWSVTQVKTISIIGDFNKWEADVDMTYNKDEGCWEATETVTDGGLKFRMNHDWTISWGGRTEDNPDLNDLTQHDGKNIPVAAGTYKFQLYISYEGNNRVVITAQ